MKEKKKYLALNWFKGYKCFDVHFWPGRSTVYLDGGERSERFFTMIGFTLFYLRVELFILYRFEGRRWL